MKSSWTFPLSTGSSITKGMALAFVFPVLLAGLLRFPLLQQRPMHCDEAVHAAKFGELLERGKYEYSTVDYHGPTLYYATLLPAWIQGAARYTEIDESTLRMVPAAAGLLLVAAHIFLIPYVGFAAAFCAALLAAVSPATVYYSRYFIHETGFVLLTFATLLSAFHYLRHRSSAWAAVTGIFFGLMYATKETVVIVWPCMLLAALVLRSATRARGAVPARFGIPGRHLALGAGAGILAAGLLLSSFLSHPSGVVDSVLAFRSYFWRGSGHDTWHVHPWHYYFNLLFYFRAYGGPVWTEGMIAALAAVGTLAVFRKSAGGADPAVSRFLALYTLLMAAAYSAIPYKAPWNLLGFLHGMILLAGIGAAWFLDLWRRAAARVAVLALLAAGVLHLGWEAWACSFRYDADPRNPWVYAHTGEDVFPIVRRLEGLARAHPDGTAMPVQIISRENLWPLPWYLRRFQSVGWWNGVSDSIPVAPVILVTPDMETALVRRLYEVPPPGRRELYVNIFDRYVELRPQVELRGYAVKSLWDHYQQLRPASGMNPPAPMNLGDRPVTRIHDGVRVMPKPDGRHNQIEAHEEARSAGSGVQSHRPLSRRADDAGNRASGKK